MFITQLLFINLYKICIQISCIFKNVIVCGGLTDANIKGNLEFPIKDVIKGYCQWDFTNSNGTIVISTNFKVKESEIDCQNEDKHLLLATYGRYILFYYFHSIDVLKI